jgi:hypothetical protein
MLFSNGTIRIIVQYGLACVGVLRNRVRNSVKNHIEKATSLLPKVNSSFMGTFIIRASEFPKF